jgi:hypothetical protein
MPSASAHEVKCIAMLDYEPDLILPKYNTNNTSFWVNVQPYTS